MKDLNAAGDKLEGQCDSHFSIFALSLKLSGMGRNGLAKIRFSDLSFPCNASVPPVQLSGILPYSLGKLCSPLE